jgi:hypothetical protein
MRTIFISLQVILITSIIGLAISYLTVLIELLPDLNFLEAVGVYALFIPFHQALTTLNNKNYENE